MPRSQFVSAALLMRVLAYVGLSFVALLVMTRLLPDGPTRTGFAFGWMVAFPTLGWLIFRRRDTP